MDESRIAISLLVLLVVTKHADAFGSGAPDSVCDTLMPSHGVPPQQSPPPYQITTSQQFVAKGDQISVTLSGTDPFIGFFIRARQNSAYIGGSFQETSVGVLRCNNQGMTHSSSESKMKLVVVWTAPDNIQSSPIHFEATFVQQRPVYWTQVKSADVTISLVASANTSLNQEAVTPPIAFTNPNFQDPNTVSQPNTTNQNQQDGNTFPQQPNSMNPGVQNPNTLPQPNPNPVFQNPNTLPQPNPNPVFQNPNTLPQPNPNPVFQDPNTLSQPNTNPVFQDPNGFPQPNVNNSIPQDLNTVPSSNINSVVSPSNGTNPIPQDQNTFPQPNPINANLQDPNAISLETTTVAAAAAAAPPADFENSNNNSFGQPGSTTSATGMDTEVIPGANTTGSTVSGRPNSLAETSNGKLSVQVGAGWALVSLTSLCLYMF